MTTHSGTSYNPMGNPTGDLGPSDAPTLEDLFHEFAADIRTQLTEFKQDVRELCKITNQRLNRLEHLELPPLPERRSYQGELNNRTNGDDLILSLNIGTVVFVTSTLMSES